MSQAAQARLGLGLDIDFDLDTCTMVAQIAHKIVNAMDSGVSWHTLAQVAKASGVDPKSLRDYLKSAVDRGVIVHHDGRYYDAFYRFAFVGTEHGSGAASNVKAKVKVKQ